MTADGRSALRQGLESWNIAGKVRSCEKTVASSARARGDGAKPSDVSDSIGEEGAPPNAATRWRSRLLLQARSRMPMLLSSSRQGFGWSMGLLDPYLSWRPRFGLPNRNDGRTGLESMG